MDAKTLDEVMPAGLPESQYAALALACLDQAGCSIRLHNKIRGMLEREGLLLADGWHSAGDLPGAPPRAILASVVEGAVIQWVEADGDALYDCETRKALSSDEQREIAEAMAEGAAG